MKGGDVNVKFLGNVPMHYAAIRNKPDKALGIMEILLRHGACPNTLRGDTRQHLLETCRIRSSWYSSWLEDLNKRPIEEERIERDLEKVSLALMSECLKDQSGELKERMRSRVFMSEKLKTKSDKLKEMMNLREGFESTQLSKLLTFSIKNHKLCKMCKARKQLSVDYHLRRKNMVNNSKIDCIPGCHFW